jgi:hypothetical protein
MEGSGQDASCRIQELGEGNSESSNQISGIKEFRKYFSS